MLARVTHDLLETGYQIDLQGKALDFFRERNKLPPSTLRALAEDQARNDRIVERVLELPETQQVLLFACSKDHAKHVAARLHLAGRKAACIVGETRGGVRQHFIRDFLDRKIQVLTNFGVLTTGFDAPKVDVTLIARPVFSPGLYQQMIGRGLRGPLNGGKPVCHLMTVLDNFLRFGNELAFRHFEHLWS